MTALRSVSLLGRLGSRNLGRNKRRTALTGAAIVLGVGLCIAIFGVTDGMNADLIGAVTRADLGDVQAHRPGYRTRRAVSLTIPRGEAIAGRAARQPGVVAAAPRAYGWAFASHGARSLGVQLMGVDPAAEVRVTTLAEKLVSGAFLSPAPTPWPEAKALTAAQEAADAELTAEATGTALDEIAALGADAGAPPPHANVDRATRALVEQIAPQPLAAPPALLGAKLARRLHARVGDTLALLGQAEGGASFDVTARVAGTFETHDDAVDQSRVVMNLADVQHLLGIGDSVHEVALRLADSSQAPSVAAALGASPDFAGLAVEPWTVMRPDLVDMLRLNDGFTELLIIIVFVLAGLGVANTMLMAVFDRRREFGVLRALGMRPRALLAMVAFETLLLSAASAALGLALGLALDVYLARHGLDLAFVGRYSLAGVGMNPVLHAAVTPRGLAAPVLTMVAVAAVASLFPAVVAARIQPAVGMRDA